MNDLATLRCVPAAKSGRTQTACAAPCSAGYREAKRRTRRSARQHEIAGEVRFDPAAARSMRRICRSTAQVPIGVIDPRKDDGRCQATVDACRARSVPILGRGCGTSLSGQTCNVAVVIDFSKYMNRILALRSRRAAGQSAARRDQRSRCATRPKARPDFAPDPATHAVVHAWRQYRQQLLRRPHRHGWQNCRQCRGTRHPDL